MPTKNLPLILSSAIAAVTAVVTCVVAFVPSLTPEKQAIIGALGAVLTLGFLIANALHAQAASRVIASRNAAQRPPTA